MTLEDLSKTVESNYRGRTAKQAGTSKYIQANVASPDGYKAELVGGTPDDVIIKPNLKNSKCDTMSFDVPKLLGIPLPLPFLKIKSSVDIKEKLPDKDKSEYGKIQVQETKGGFVDLKDETPGNKRWMKLHPAGTYSQVVNNGDMHEKIVHDRYIIIDNNWNISVGADQIEIIMGNNKIQIKKDRQTNINGNDNMNVDGDRNTVVTGNDTKQITGNDTEKITGDMTSDITGKLTETIKKDYIRTVQGKQNTIVMKDINQISCASINIIATAPITISSSAKVSISAPKISLN